MIMMMIAMIASREGHGKSPPGEVHEPLFEYEGSDNEEDANKQQGRQK